MNLAAGYIAQTLQSHDAAVAARVNERRQIAAERRAGTSRMSGATETAKRAGLVRRIVEGLHYGGRAAASVRPAH